MAAVFLASLTFSAVLAVAAASLTVDNAVVEIKPIEPLYIYGGYQRVSLKDHYTGYNLSYSID